MKNNKLVSVEKLLAFAKKYKNIKFKFYKKMEGL